MQLEGRSFSLTASDGSALDDLSTLPNYFMSGCTVGANEQKNAESAEQRQRTHIGTSSCPPFIRSLMSCSSGLERSRTQITWAQEGTSPHNEFFCLLKQWSKRHGLSFPSDSSIISNQTHASLLSITPKKQNYSKKFFSPPFNGLETQTQKPCVSNNRNVTHF